MESATITIHMTRGGTMTVDAEGDIFDEDKEVGCPRGVEDLTCFWPDRKGRKASKKPREIGSEFYDEERAREDFIQAVQSNSDGARADYFLARREAR